MKCKIYIKISCVLLGFLGFVNPCMAERVHGFIVTENSDTISGKIILPFYNQNNFSFIVNGIDLESFNICVRFKSNVEKCYHNYYPENIKSFCFYYESDFYIFQKFQIQKNALLKKDTLICRFLSQVYKGELSLYKDMVRIPDVNNSRKHIDCGFLYYDYYLFNEKKGLKKVELTNEISSLKELLAYYNLEEEFLKQIPNDAEFRKIQTFLEKYDSWFYATYSLITRNNTNPVPKEINFSLPALSGPYK